MTGHDSHRRSHLRLPLIGRFVPPFGNNFVAVEATGAALLVLAVIVALLWANLAGGSYEAVWSYELFLGIGPVGIEHSLHDWTGEGLMTIFFFVLGLELKRELVTGALRAPKAAALPIGAAIGGALVPALIFVAIVRGGTGSSGWAVPMATDAALALGVLTALGRRAAPGAKTVLLTIAIVDDLIAILVIAVFFTGGVDPAGAIAASAVVGSVLVLRRFGVTHPAAYVPSGIALWIALGAAGIHPTIAGALLGLLTPARTPDDVLRRVEDRVHPWAALFVVPVFALSAVGVEISSSSLRTLGEPIALGIAIGLIVGKTVGIAGTGALLLRFRLATLPPDAGHGALLGVAVLGGVGLSVALFITDLALTGPSADAATMGLLVGSTVAAALGAGVFLTLDRRRSLSDVSPSGTMESDREEGT